MTTNILNEPIAITVTTEQDLMALDKAFLGHAPSQPLQDLSDDYLVASLLGWHMQNAKMPETSASKYVYTEFALRRGLAAGGDFTDENSDVRSLTRGVPNTLGHNLTSNGINPQTLSEIENRIATLVRRYSELYQLAVNETNAEDHAKTWRFVAGFSDQEIIDVGTWAMLAICDAACFAGEPYPADVESELLFRGLSWRKA